MLFKSVSNTNFSCVSTVELTLRIYETFKNALVKYKLTYNYIINIIKKPRE
jgi:hypothetical protein